MVFHTVHLLYVPPDVDDAWWRQMDFFMINDLGLLQCVIDSYGTSVYRLPSNATFNTFRWMCHRIAGLSLTRAEILASINVLAQVTSKCLTRQDVKIINKTLAHVEDSVSFVLTSPNPDLAILTILTYSEVFFGNNQNAFSSLESRSFLPKYTEERVYCPWQTESLNTWFVSYSGRRSSPSKKY